MFPVGTTVYRMKRYDVAEAVVTEIRGDGSHLLDYTLSGGDRVSERELSTDRRAVLVGLRMTAELRLKTALESAAREIAIAEECRVLLERYGHELGDGADA